MRHPSCDHGEEGILAAGERAFNFDRSFLEGCIRIQKTERTRSFRSYPIASGICVADHGHACAALLSESSKVATPLLDTASSGCLAARKLTEVFWYCDQRVQHIMQFVGIAHVGPSFFANLGDGRRIELAYFFQHCLRQNLAH